MLTEEQNSLLRLLAAEHQRANRHLHTEPAPINLITSSAEEVWYEGDGRGRG